MEFRAITEEMTTQDRLQEVIREAVYPYLISGIRDGFSMAVLQALSDEGVVRKVEGKLPEVAEDNPWIRLDEQARMLRAGYEAVGPVGVDG